MTSEQTPAPRRATEGDISPDLSPEGIEDHVVGDAVTGAIETQLAVVRDVLTNSSPGDRVAVARWLAAVIDGVSPDEMGGLRRIILDHDEPIYGTPPLDSDDQLADAWQHGNYPYANLMGRKAYEAQKYHLQVELLKLRPGSKRAGSALSFCSKAETRLARAARSNGSWST